MESARAPRHDVDPTRPSLRRRGGVRRTLLWVLALALLVAVVVAVEIGSPRRIAPTGVDEITGPPTEFVAEVDHPWLPLAPGASWAYAGEVDGEAATVRVTVLGDPVDVDGIGATAVRTVVEREGEASTVEHWVAQDVVGNLWLLGREGLWDVSDGTPAGLVLAAAPRRGDAHLVQPLAGEERWVVEVGESVDDVAVPAGRYDDGVRLLLRNGASRGEERVTEVTVVRDVGVVRAVGPDVRLELEEWQPGR
ncbi:hypothetical protein [Nocardioides jishulii]|uniref:hypothetical protein n=1 Tax=Nocardioides jishulii TaxID=2575440 RepID=UPI001485B581|nr:hypothetical protein [Nocardioides jishulii]